MSLILEALKKSEAKRRLGDAPDIGTPFALKRRRRSPLPLIVIAIVIVGALGWWFTRTPEQATQPAGAASAPQSSGQFANVTPGSPTTPPNAAVKRTAADRIAHLPTAPKPAMPAPAPVQQNPAVVAAPAPTGVAANSTPLPIPPAAKTVTNASAPVNVVADATPPAHAGQKPFPPPATATATDEIKSSSDIKSATKSDAADKSAAASAPMYYELAYAVRKDLPAMTVSMHVYAVDPAQRFVIINGDRYAEGDSVKDDLVLREIQSDGLIMEFRGQRFFYPRNSR
jgi:general secretion pathway protein B